MSNACAALNNSMAKIRSRLSTTFNAFVAAFAPMLTWSSCPLLDTILSVLAGTAYCLFWLTILAAVYCGIMKPEFNPGFCTKMGANHVRPKSIDKFFFQKYFLILPWQLPRSQETKPKVGRGNFRQKQLHHLLRKHLDCRLPS